jgi:hypothetical protein
MNDDREPPDTKDLPKGLDPGACALVLAGMWASFIGFVAGLVAALLLIRR